MLFYRTDSFPYAPKTASVFGDPISRGSLFVTISFCILMLRFPFLFRAGEKVNRPYGCVIKTSIQNTQCFYNQINIFFKDMRLEKYTLECRGFGQRAKRGARILRERTALTKPRRADSEEKPCVFLRERSDKRIPFSCIYSPFGLYKTIGSEQIISIYSDVPWYGP